MKLKIFSLATLTLLFSVTTAFAAIDSTSTKFFNEKSAQMTEAQRTARIEEIKNRVEEIKNMDRSELSPAERKDLKTELRSMNREARAMTHGGVYLSVGAIIIIILLLILIL